MQRRDITTEAVTRQVEAMGCDVFEVGVFDAKAERMLIKTWDKETVLRSVPYLKHQNMQGNHIYIRPHGEHGLTLVDDLTAQAVKQMERDGFTPAVLTETSPRNFQAWVKHSGAEKLPTAISTEAARELATRYGGDPGSADWRHFGRLAGFTNCKDKHRQPNGLFPFVRLHGASGQVYGHAADFIDGVRQQHDQRLADEQARRKQYEQAAPVQPQAGRSLKTIDDFRRNPAYGSDDHRADLAYATYALSKGVGAGAIEQALRTRDLTHKGSEARQRDYIDRTIAKAAERAKGRGLT
jgi:hypothetical protein